MVSTTHAYGAASVYRIDQCYLAQGVPLMSKAANAVANACAQLLSANGIAIQGATVTLLAGGGNNGGDGLFAVSQLAKQGAQIRILSTSNQLHQEACQCAQQAGCQVCDASCMTDDQIAFIAHQSSVIIDAMTGIGLTGDLRGQAARVAEIICRVRAQRINNDIGFNNTLTNKVDHEFSDEFENEVCNEFHNKFEELSRNQLKDRFEAKFSDELNTGFTNGTNNGTTNRFNHEFVDRVDNEFSNAGNEITNGFNHESDNIVVSDCSNVDPLHAENRTVASSDNTVSNSQVTLPLVVAVDTPSGVGVDDGTLPGTYIEPSLTITFGVLKPCALLPPACYHQGTLVLADIYPDEVPQKPTVHCVTRHDVYNALNKPTCNDNKYTRGVVGLLTGSQRYPGAGLLSAQAASRSNVGMIRYCGCNTVASMLVPLLPEVVLEHGRVQAWVVGSGIASTDQGEQEHAAILDIFTHIDTVPICIDAGAIDLIKPEMLALPANAIITPHAGELARLLCRFDQDVQRSDIEEKPLHWAKLAQQLTGATVLLKGSTTLIVSADEVWVNTDAPAWLATAGSGDVLAGVIGALLAQRQCRIEAGKPHGSIAHSVAAAAWLHSYAGNLASQGNKPIIASDIIAKLPQAIGKILGITR